MKNMLIKELRLTASPLSLIFILFALLTFCPGYPILVGSGFFVCLGIFQSFQSARVSNDIVYSALLPIRKADAVKSRYLFCVFIELCAFVISAAVTLLRMTALSGAEAYLKNALMTANLVYLSYLLVIYGLFNAVFVRGFFKTAYYFTKPFVAFCVLAFLVVGIAETLVHVPALNALNTFGFENIGLQLCCLIAGIILFATLTILSEKSAEKLFERIDL